jgi:hypothetical protein
VDRGRVGGAGDILVAYGVAVHRGVVERRQPDRRDDVLGHGEAEGVHQRLWEVRQRLEGPEDPGQVVVDRDQGLIVGLSHR